MEAEERNTETKNRRLMVRGRPIDDLESAPKLSTVTRRINNVILAKYLPSYCLMLGIGSIQRDLNKNSLRSQHRKKLRQLLLMLLRRHNWAEASGVLSVLHRGTSKETAISKNRAKFSATLEILKRIKGDSFSSKKIQNVYWLWMRKSMKNSAAIQLENNLFCLTSKEMDDAYQAALSLKQGRGFEGDSVSNLVVGLTFYELWYSTLPKEMHLDEQNEFGSNMQSDIFENNMCMSIVDSRGHEAAEGEETNSMMQCDSNTSVRNDKENMEAGSNPCGEGPMDADNNPEQKVSPDGSQPQDVSMHTAENSEPENSNASDSPPSLSTFYSCGLPQWLLPMQLPQVENLEELYDMHRQLRSDLYISAVNFFRQALNSVPPTLEAFHPLLQLLLLGDKVKEALDVVEKVSPDSSPVLHLRLKAHLLAHFDSSNYAKLATCFEDVLKKDPTCSHSLERLTNLHRIGEYSTEKLVEMIALNLDATHAKCNTWKDFASCLLKLSHAEEDTESICVNGDDDGLKQNSLTFVSRVSEIFRTPESRRSWRLRCRWWLRRHFSQSILASDIASGDIELVTYKAAAACHLYGSEFGYVVKVMELLKEENNMDMLFVLKTHGGRLVYNEENSFYGEENKGK